MNTFEFVSDETLLSGWHLAWMVPCIYLSLLAGLKKWVRNHDGFELQTVVFVHNAVLSVASAVLLLGMVAELFRMFGEGGFWSVFCDAEGRWTSGTMYFYLYINYLLKYVELGDTFLLALRGKPTPFLHVYHHAATLVLCLTQLRGQTSLQWLVVTINLFVHVLMYAFYALHTIGIHVWWKRYLTILQIAQFVIVVVICGLGFLLTPFSFLGIVQQRCHGDIASQTFGMIILLSYLFLFIKFYERTYPKKSK